tara:strand:- start:12146 stop:13222 length:1077 start_codon:yes stop_codon:yes gene_type:complete
VSAIHTINARGDIGLTSSRSRFKMSPAQFGAFVRSHHEVLERELASMGVAYSSLGPALVPSTTRHEIALLFNVEGFGWWYGRRIAQLILPLLDQAATMSVLEGDIALPPAATRELAHGAGLHPAERQNWGDQYVYCVYLTNLSDNQVTQLDTALAGVDGYLGYVPATYRSEFKSVAATMLPTTFVKQGKRVLVDHGSDDPWVGDENPTAYDFASHGYEVRSVTSMLFSPLLSYKIQAEFRPHFQEDVLISLNAISDDPIPLEGFEVLLPEAKFGYLQDKKGGLLTIAELDTHSREQLAAVIRAEIDNDYIYRLQRNVDDTVQFSIILELPRKESHPVRLAVGLKYFPTEQTLSLVTMT